jgi:hypothetical protein
MSILSSSERRVEMVKDGVLGGRERVEEENVEEAMFGENGYYCRSHACFIARRLTANVKDG